MVSIEDPTQTALQCPHCGGQFSIAGEEAPEHAATGAIDDAQAWAEMESRREGDLSELRIRQVASLRRGVYRTRSWLIIGASTCAVGFAQLVHLAIRDGRFGLRLGPMFDAILAVLAALIFWHFVARIRALSREIRESRMHDPATPPDFSTLSDGSQRWTNLDELANRTNIRER
ncbi:MAG TPA: hypothetical protein VGI81_29485 [Tepidisphaeraceae bacterium]